jgi:hypothetical protein
VTTVKLKRADGAQPPVQILLFSHEYATMNLKLEWMSPTHLNVVYGASTKPGDDVNLEFQAIRCAGIDISLQDLSSPASSASTPR